MSLEDDKRRCLSITPNKDSIVGAIHESPVKTRQILHLSGFIIGCCGQLFDDISKRPLSLFYIVLLHLSVSSYSLVRKTQHTSYEY